MIKVNGHVPEPWGANERLDLQHGKFQRQIQLQESFVLTNTIPNPLGAPTFGGVPRKASSLIYKPKAPVSLMGAANVTC
jgi:hypothetical protein